jgi:hypothetical protein
MSSNTQFVSLTIGNPYYDVAPVLRILFPYTSSVCCYSNVSVPLKIGMLLLNNSVEEDYTPQICYSLDNGNNITLTNLTKGESWAKVSWLQSTVSFTASSTLYNLSEGNHTLCAYSVSGGKQLSAKVTFKIDSNYKEPELTLISPTKSVYTSSEVQLIFSTNKAYKNARYTLDYHLDTERTHYISIDGNTTLTNLTDGLHKIILFADCYDEYHDGISEAQGTSFNVSIDVNATKVEDITEAQNNLTIDYRMIFVTTAAVAIAVAVATLLYLKKRKRGVKSS